MTAGKKKADVVECPEAYDHVGLLVNQPLPAGRGPFNQSSDFFYRHYMDR